MHDDTKNRSIWAQGILTFAANTTTQKTNRFQALDDNSTLCINQLSWLIENDFKLNKSHSSSLSNESWKSLLLSDLELPRQAENHMVE